MAFLTNLKNRVKSVFTKKPKPVAEDKTDIPSEWHPPMAVPTVRPRAAKQPTYEPAALFKGLIDDVRLGITSAAKFVRPTLLNLSAQYQQPTALGRVKAFTTDVTQKIEKGVKATFEKGGYIERAGTAFGERYGKMEIDPTGKKIPVGAQQFYKDLGKVLWTVPQYAERFLIQAASSAIPEQLGGKRTIYPEQYGPIISKALGKEPIEPLIGGFAKKVYEGTVKKGYSAPTAVLIAGSAIAGKAFIDLPIGLPEKSGIKIVVRIAKSFDEMDILADVVKLGFKEADISPVILNALKEANTVEDVTSILKTVQEASKAEQAAGIGVEGLTTKIRNLRELADANPFDEAVAVELKKTEEAYAQLTKAKPAMDLAVEAVQKNLDAAKKFVGKQKPQKAVVEETTSPASQIVKETIERPKKVIENIQRPTISSEIRTEMSQMKERGYITSVKEVFPEVSAEGTYIPRSTDTLAIQAKNLITDNLDEAEKYIEDHIDDKSVAIASELVNKWGNEALVAKSSGNTILSEALNNRAAQIANMMAPKLTEAGRTVQAASILGRLTPEGQVRFAALEIQKYNRTVSAAKQIPELTGEQAGKIFEEMTEIKKMPDTDVKLVRFQKLQDDIQTLIPTPLWKKLTTVWRAGLLTGIKTTGLNIFSTLSHSVSEIVKDVPAAFADSVASLFTGERTKTFTLRGIKGGVEEGFEKGWRYFTTGFDERNIGAKMDYKKINFGKGKVAQAFQTYTDTIFRAMGAEDQPFYYGSLARSLMDQALAQGKNQGLKGKTLVGFTEKLVQNPTEEMLRYGTADAATAIFSNKTYLGTAGAAIQKIPVLGEITVPFSRTPSAVAMQIVRYSPAGAVSEIISQIAQRKLDQRLLVGAIGRSTMGIVPLYIGYKLLEKGLMTLNRPQGEREQKLWELEGKKPNSILINGKWRSPIVLGPPGLLLLVGGHFQQSFQKEGSPTKAITQALLGGAKSFTEQTFLKGMNFLLDALNSPERYGDAYLKNLVASVIPTLISDIGRVKDPLERRTESIWEAFKARIPGLRETLEPSIDVLGKGRESIGNMMEILADPTRPSPAKTTPVISELRRLTDTGFPISPTLLGDKKGYDVLSQKQNTYLWEKTGKQINGMLTILFKTKTYQKLSDEDKAKIVEQFIDRTKTEIRAKIVQELTRDLSGEELLKELSEFIQSKLLTKEVFKEYEKLKRENPEKYEDKNKIDIDKQEKSFSVSQYLADDTDNDLIIIDPVRKERNEVLKAAPKINLIQNIIHTIKNKLPFFESDAGKALKQDALSSYKFTEDAKQIMKSKTKVSDVSPEFDAVLNISRMDGELYMGEKRREYSGLSTANRKTLLPDRLLPEAIAARIPLSLYKFADKLLPDGRNQIKISRWNTETVAHELLHGYIDKKGFKYSYQKFNEDWEKAKEDENNKLFKKRMNIIDDILFGGSSLYENIDEYAIANERLAYLGGFVGVQGMSQIPSILRKHYEDILEK